LKNRANTMRVRLITMITIGLMMQFAPVMSWGQETEALAGETLAVIERDTIQTRNFVPVINHEAMIVNLTDKPIIADILSPLPAEKYSKDSPLAAFGRNSLLGAPMFSPFPVPSSGQIILEKPAVKLAGQQVVYAWEKTELPPAKAVIAQYDNFYGPKSDFYRDFGLEIARLQVISDYSVKKTKNTYRVLLNITLKNVGDQPIEEFFFRLFLPTDASLKGGGDMQALVGMEEVWASDHVNIGQSTIVDGFNRTASGIDASSQIGVIPAKSEVQCVIQMDCKKIAETGEIYPLLYLLGRQKLIRLWPGTEIKTEKDVGRKKEFQYLFYNLVIPDRFVFKLTREGIGVEQAR